MRVSGVKNLLILFLSILCIVLTTRIWFGKNWDKTFLLDFISPIFNLRSENAAYDEFIKPYRIIVKNDAEISTVYERVDETAVWSEVLTVVDKMMRDYEYAGTRDAGYADFAETAKRYIIFEYAFLMPKTEFCAAFSQMGFAPKIDDFDAAVIFEDENGAAVRFIYREKGTAQEFRLHRDTHITCEMPAGVPFVFKENNFVAADGLDYHYACPYLPFSDDGEIKKSYVEKKAAYLFNNSAAVISDNVNSVYKFIEGNTVVKYYSSNVLEYSNYKIPESGGTSFMAAYSAAAAFLRRDETLENEYFMAGFRENGNTWFFDFDLKANHFPLIITKGQKEEIGMEHAIEITVQNGVVSKYKRFAYNFVVGDSSTAKIGFEDAYTAANGAFLREDSNAINKAELGFSLDAASLADVLKLAWFFETKYDDHSGGVYFVPSSFPAQ